MFERINLRNKLSYVNGLLKLHYSVSNGNLLNIFANSKYLQRAKH